MTPSLRRWLVASAAALVFAATATIAHADQAQAKQLYDDGEKAYNLGQFDKAIDLFTKAYEAWPEPAFLFNIAQAYRQDGNCKQALFFYKRFLSLKENDTKKPIKPEIKKDVEGRIAELEDCVKRDIANRPPDSLDDGHGSGSGSGAGSGSSGAGSGSGSGAGAGSGSGSGAGSGSGSGTRVGDAGDGSGSGSDDGSDGGSDGSDTGVSAGVEVPPKLVSVRASGGAAKLGIGNLNPPMQLAIAVVGGYPLQLAPKLELDVGAGVTFTPLPYDKSAAAGGGSGTASLLGLLANAGAAYEVAPKMSARGDLGLGVQMFSGLQMGNPFTVGGAPTTGALTVFNVRVAASFEYAFTNNLVGEITPIAFSYSPKPSGLNPDISALTTLSFLIGVGYRM